MIKYSVSQIQHIKQQALLMAQGSHEVMLLDNNFCKNAFNLHQIEFAAAFGIIDFIAVNINCFEELVEFKAKHQTQYIFTQLQYDLKNELEKLTSNHNNSINFEQLIAFVPAQLLVIDAHGNCLEGKDLAEYFLSKPQQQFNDESAPVVMQAKVTKAEYINNVEQIKNHILEGDVYELNYCTEFYNNQASINPYQVYHKLRETSPVPFGAFFKWNNNYLLCASPERFLVKINDKVYSQPIKGTSPRSTVKAEDEAQKQFLINSEKERAENLMIVDLVRNDLAKTAQTGTIKVEELFGIYSFKQVHQMISTVSAKPKVDTQDVEIIKQAFPMGSMTGAPKIMSMQLIEQYENTKRGL